MSINIGVMMFATQTTIDMVSLARTVESLGFESLFLPEHAIVPRDFTSPYPAGGETPNRTADEVNFHVVILSCMRSDCP